MEQFRSECKRAPKNNDSSTYSSETDRMRTEGGQSRREEQPWLNPDGSHKSEPTLKFESKQWTHAQWDAYLATLESAPSESLLANPDYIDTLTNAEYAAAFFADLNNTLYPELEVTMRCAILSLSPRESQILKLKYFEGLANREIGQQLGLPADSVGRIGRRAVAHLRDILSDPMKLRRVIHTFRKHALEVEFSALSAKSPPSVRNRSFPA